jgi:hypothetical protein
MEYDLQFKEAKLKYNDFEFSSFNNINYSEYDCMIKYLEDKYTKYFEIHVFFSRNDCYSVPIRISTKDLKEFDDDSIINFAVTFDKLNGDDAIMVDRVEEIEYGEYIDMGGK